jgi:hypothetical protein
MCFNSDLADTELKGDLLVKQPGDNETHHLFLATERCERSRSMSSSASSSSYLVPASKARSIARLGAEAAAEADAVANSTTMAMMAVFNT